ncbi:MAG TPA: alpha/beta fold hydrolase [Gemmatimonadota bacterium]|nr:alpha/beta fold hydrolase [Gemmatimonadota bacterium]
MSTAMLLLSLVTALRAQVPAELDARLLFRLGAGQAGSETFHIERLQDGGFALRADVDLQVPSLRIVQHIEVTAGPRLAFREARVFATLNDGDTTDVVLVRDGGVGRQTTRRGGTTDSADLETPAGSVLLTNNVIVHMIQFAWLHDGAVGESRNLVAFPNVPVVVEFQQQGQVEKDGVTLTVRRYYLNLANRVGAFVWLAADGMPLKLTVPLQAFEALNESYIDWADLLVVGPAAPEGGAAPPPYDAEEVTFPSDSIALAGTLTIPRGEGPWPAAVLITGSGAQNRDEDTEGPGGLKLGIFRDIADTLTRRGIAVLRYDDRGVGGSGGSLATAGLSDLVGDVEAAVTYLRARGEIDVGRIGLIGHSEGAIIAPIVAADDAGIAAIVLMAGTAAPLDSVIMDQVASAAREAGADSSDVLEARESVARLAEAIREDRDLSDVDLPEAIRALATNRKWLSEHIKHDPEATLRQVTAPVLVVNGGMDVQVPPEHARRLGAVLEDAGNPDYEVKIFADLNHLFAKSKGQGTAEYADPTAKVDPGFLSFMADWLTGRLRAD